MKRLIQLIIAPLEQFVAALRLWLTEQGEAPAPAPAPTPEPVPAPAPPAPVPTPAPQPDPEDFAREVVYADKLAPGWYDYSWATVQKGAEVTADLDDWRALNLHFSAGKRLDDYTGVVFRCRATRAGDSFALYITDGNAQVGTGTRVTPTAEMREYRFTWQQLGVPANGRFTNVVCDGGAPGQREPFVFDDIALLKRATPAPLPEAPPMTAAPATGGWLNINAAGDFVDDTGAVWVGKGVNIPDNRLFNAGAGLALPVAFGELKRRVTYAKITLGVDFLRYCVHQDAGVMQASAEWWGSVKEFVTWCWTEHRIRVLFSFWREGTLKTLTQAPTGASVPAWQMVTSAFANSGHVLFGISNEPQTQAPGDWEAFDAVRRGIREQEAKLGAKGHVIAIQGASGWARNIAAYENRRFADALVAYETHAYDHAADFEARFVRLKKAGMPVLVGEWGPAVIQANTSMANYNNLNLADDLYWSTPNDCRVLWNLMQQHRVPSCAWALSCRAWPDLLKDNTGGGAGVGMPLELTAWGETLKGLAK